MTINKLLIGAVLVGMVACYGCTPDEPITIERDPAIVEVNAEGKTGLGITKEMQGNYITKDFLVSMAQGLFDGDFWNPGDNTFLLELYSGGHLVGAEYWYDAEITVYGGDGSTDTVAFVSSSEPVLAISSGSQITKFWKSISIGNQQIAQNAFTNSVSPGDYLIVAWTYSFSTSGPSIMYATDTLKYIFAEALAQNTSVPYPHTARFIYKKGATIDSSEVTLTPDSIQYAPDTSWTKNWWHATDSDRSVDDTLDITEFLDTEDRIIAADSSDYAFTEAGAIRQPFQIKLYSNPEIP